MFKQLDFKNIVHVEEAFPLIQQLRPHLNLHSFMELLPPLERVGYEIWQYFDDGKLVGAIGLRRHVDLVRGTHIYIDDLVVDKDVRSKGIGAKLLAFAEKICHDEKIPSLRLECALQNTEALRFYLREKWIQRSNTLVKRGAEISKPA